MKLIISVVCLALVFAVSAAQISSAVLSPVYNYHSRFGIPRALALQKLEAEESSGTQRIVGGQNIDITQVPYQGGLVLTVNWFWTSVCSASLISANRVVTAAHCQNDGVNIVNSITVVLGSNTIFSDGVRIATRDIVMHPNWNYNTAANDIAVIRLPTAVALSNTIRPIALPDSQVGNNFVGWTALASGFGLTADGGNIPTNQRISAVSLPVISNVQCAAVYGPWVHNTNICTSGAGARGTCDGDSGGPLAATINNAPALIGVTSYGADSGCSLGFPAAYARVTDFISWIRSI